MTEEMRHEIVQRRQSGMSLRAIAEELGMAGGFLADGTFGSVEAKFVNDQKREPGVEANAIVDRLVRNDKCPCGSGKKFKRCCMLQEPSMGDAKKEQNLKSRMKLREILALVDECVLLVGFVNSTYWLFGVSREESPIHAKVWEGLVSLRQQFVQAGVDAEAPKKNLVFRREPDTLLEELRTVKQSAEENRDILIGQRHFCDCI